jgi:hypothetical protein
MKLLKEKFTSFLLLMQEIVSGVKEAKARRYLGR